MSTKKSQSKPRRPSPKKADAKLVRENNELRRERDESLERETATSDILRMIARSPAELSRYSMRLPKELRDSVTLKMLLSFALMAIFCGSQPTSARSLWQILWARAASLTVAHPLVEQSLIDRRYMSTIFEPPTLNFRVPDQWNRNGRSYRARHTVTS